MLFKKRLAKRSFNDVLTTLGERKFDVAPAAEGAGKRASAYRVSKYGCCAEIAAAPDAPERHSDMAIASPAVLLSRPGVLVNGQIACILDRGYQKFLSTPKLEIVATADHLRALHQFREELDKSIGELMLYNESLGTTSDKYMYDRVKGREHGHQEEANGH